MVRPSALLHEFTAVIYIHDDAPFADLQMRRGEGPWTSGMGWGTGCRWASLLAAKVTWVTGTRGDPPKVGVALGKSALGIANRAV